VHYTLVISPDRGLLQLSHSDNHNKEQNSDFQLTLNIETLSQAYGYTHSYVSK
jgi:hypothetical protein